MSAARDVVPPLLMLLFMLLLLLLLLLSLSLYMYVKSLVIFLLFLKGIQWFVSFEPVSHFPSPSKSHLIHFISLPFSSLSWLCEESKVTFGFSLVILYGPPAIAVGSCFSLV
ncbi:MAG TPA: hypothetical protein ENL13_05360 [Thermoplasmatales archaeon]|nr:hypothetical protein [Thermoplasmatales archaeon]